MSGGWYDFEVRLVFVIVGCICDGYIIPILPSSYDYNDVFLKNAKMLFYYDIKSNELRDAKDMIFFGTDGSLRSGNRSSAFQG